MRFSWFKIMLAAIAVAFTVGCGGGGGGGGSSTPAPTLEFSMSGGVSVHEKTTDIPLIVKNASGSVTFAITGGVDADKFTISGNVLSFKTAPDYANPGDANHDNIYEVTVKATDASNHSDTLSMRIEVTNKVLYFTSKDTFTVDENTTTVTTLAVANASGSLTYKISGGADADKFKITGDQLSFVNRPDYENPDDANKDRVYEVLVEATDAVESVGKLFKITVTNIDTGLEFTIDNQISIKEKTATVTTLATSGGNGPVTYTISGGKDKDKFVITRPNNVLTFKTAPVYQPDSTNVYEVTVEANDGIDAVDLDMNISVVPLPITFTSPADVTVSELTQEVQTLTIDNAHGRVEYFIVGGADKNKFTVNKDKLVFITPPDYDNPDDADGNRIYVVEVEAKDAAGVTADQTKHITITSLGHPEFTSEANISVPEYTTDVTTVKLISQYNINSLTMEGDDASLFTFTASDDKKSGVITFKNPPVYDANGNNTYKIVIKAIDENSNETDFPMTITVTDVVGSDVNITSAVYDDNLTDSLSDDTLTIYFSAEIDENSLPATIADAFVINGIDCIGSATNYHYSKGWPFKLTINLDGTAQIPDENTTIAIKNEVIKLADGSLIAASPAKNIEFARPIYKTGQTVSYNENGQVVSDGSLKDDGFYQLGKTNTLTRDDSKEVVIDRLNGLMWQDDEAAKTVRKTWITKENYDNGNYFAKEDGDTAYNYCQGLTLGGYDDWRLPSIEELNTIIVKGKKPAIDDVFQNVANYWYWSDTPCDECLQFAWAVKVDEGLIRALKNYKYYDHYFVRCVRDNK